MMPDTLEAARNLEVLGRDGKAVEFSTLWRDRPAVLAFVRHFG